MTKVVCFDLDDTLIAEALFIMSGASHIAKWLHDRYPALPTHRLVASIQTAAMTRQNHYSAIERLLQEHGLSDIVDMNTVIAEFRRHMPDPTIYHVAPSLLEVLTKLRNSPDIKTVLITDGRSLTQRNKIKAAGLLEFFDDCDIFISEETGHDKTSPDTFLRVMEKYARASEFHYVGDNPPKDFLHPSRLGWHTHQTHPFPLMVHQGIPR